MQRREGSVTVHTLLTMKDFVIQTVKAAGEVLLQHLAQGCVARVKENHSSVVTAADYASEKLLIDALQTRFPDHGIVAEESGFRPGSSDFVWVIDPLDGTSNFAAGLPWFGVLLGLLERGKPVLGIAYLPVTDTLYVAEAGGGAFRDGLPVRISIATDLHAVLCAHAMDASAQPGQTRREAAMMGRLINAARNVRATNSLIDFCYTIDGRLGGAVNHATRIWDIAALTLLIREAGGRMTDLAGRDVELILDDQVCSRNYPVVGTSPILLPQILAALHGPD